MEQKSRGDKRSFVFLQENIFSNEIYSRKLFLNDKRHKEEMIKAFFCKSWRDGFFSKHEKISRQ